MPTLTTAQAFQIAGQNFFAGDLAAAEAMGRRILEAEPSHADVLNMLGLIAQRRGQLGAAAGFFERAIRVNPAFPPYHCNLAVALCASGHVEAAERACRTAVVLAPDYADGWFNLGLVLGERGALDPAAEAYRTVLRLNPESPAAWTNLGNILKRQGRIDDAITAFRRGVEINPHDADAHGVLVQSLRYHPRYSATAITAEEAAWEDQHGAPLRQRAVGYAVTADPEKRVRVGYVSPDFRDHVVGLNVLPLFEAHDRDRFEIFCYSGVTKPDAVTERFRALASGWRETNGVPDEALAATIRSDEIDILVDLALHTAHNRLLVFARKPAPVQFSFAGYPGGTGLSAIEHRISDRYLEGGADERPAGEQEGVHAIGSFWCYAALAAPVEVGPLPAFAQGRVTFGCLNRCWKVNDEVIRLWSQVLRNFSDARLILQSPSGSHRVETLAKFSTDGILPDRVCFLEQQARDEYLAAYRNIDIGLDTFPYNGHTTSLDSWWMGVPVVTLPGETIVSRGGLSQAMNLLLPELVATSADHFVQIATELATDLPRLGRLRATLRERMKSSVLMDGSRFAQDIERAYRAMWREWCARQAPAHGPRPEGRE